MEEESAAATWEDLFKWEDGEIFTPNIYNFDNSSSGITEEANIDEDSSF